MNAISSPSANCSTYMHGCDRYSTYLKLKQFKKQAMQTACVRQASRHMHPLNPISNAIGKPSSAQNTGISRSQFHGKVMGCFAPPLRGMSDDLLPWPHASEREMTGRRQEKVFLYGRWWERSREIEKRHQRGEEVREGKRVRKDNG